MADNSDLYQALQMFNQGMHQAATTQAVNDATAAMNQIHGQGLDEGAQRQQLDGLSKQLALRLTGIGAPAAAVQQAMQAVGPRQYGSVAEMQMEGALTGNKYLQSTAKTMSDIATKKMQQEKQFEQKLKLGEIAAQGGNALQVQMMKNMADKQAANKITAEDVTKLSAIDDISSYGKDLIQRLNTSKGALSGPLSSIARDLNPNDADFAAFKADTGRFFDLYRVAVTGAGASPGELKMLEKNVPTVSDRPEIFKRKMQNMIRFAEMKKSNHVKNLGLTGRDVSGLLGQMRAEAQSKQAETNQMSNLLQAGPGGGEGQ